MTWICIHRSLLVSKETYVYIFTFHVKWDLYICMFQQFDILQRPLLCQKRPMYIHLFQKRPMYTYSRHLRVLTLGVCFGGCVYIFISKETYVYIFMSSETYVYILMSSPVRVDARRVLWRLWVRSIAIVRGPVAFCVMPAYMYICIYIYICTYIYMHIHVYICIYVCYD